MADRDRGGRDHLVLLLREATRDAACPCVLPESLRKWFPCSGLAGMTRAELHGIAGGTVEEDRVKKAT